MQMFAKGYSKSLGVLRYSQSDTIPEVTAGQPSKTFEDIKSEVSDLVELMDDKSVLIDMAGGRDRVAGECGLLGRMAKADRVLRHPDPHARPGRVAVILDGLRPDE